MPLINCPDCKNKMSDTAVSCPKCGKPNTYDPSKKKSPRDFLWLGVLLMPYIFSWFTLRKKYSKFVKFVSFSWLLLFAIPLITKENTNNINHAVRDNSAKKVISAQTVAKPETTTKQKDDQAAMNNDDIAIERSASTGPDTITGKPTKDFTTCVMAQAKNDTSGQLSSFDGGNSAMKMMVECEATWHAYLDECIQKTQKTEGDCNVEAAILAQSALKLLGK